MGKIAENSDLTLRLKIFKRSPQIETDQALGVIVSLKQLIDKKRKKILDHWYHFILDTYPAQAATFLRKNRDRFENPVGQRIVEGIEGLLDEILGDFDGERIQYFVDRIVRVRAVQDFSPSVAVNFVLSLKRAIREVLKNDLTSDLFEEYMELEDKIDQIGMYSFDVYMACREKLYHLKVEEWKKRLFMVLRRANVIYDEREGIPPQQQ